MRPFVIVFLALAFAACGGSASQRVFAAREKGCAIELSAGMPSAPTTNIGSVSAWCAQEDSDEQCQRALKDAACELGADVVWGVGAPVVQDGKKRLSGRAAHTKPR